MSKLLFDDDLLGERKVVIKIFFPLALFAIFVFIATIVSCILESEKINNPLVTALFFSLWSLSFISYFVYYALYTKKYKILVYDDQIIKKSLFGTVTVLYPTIRTYSYEKYNRVSGFFIFTLKLDKRKVIVYTRYCNELVEILNSKLNSN